MIEILSLPNKNYKAIFFDFGDTLAFNNQSFVEGLHNLLKTLDINVGLSKLKAVIEMADYGFLVEERLKAKSEEDYRAYRIKYYRYVLEHIGYPQEDNKNSGHIHNMISYYHNTYLKPETMMVLSILKKEGYRLGIISNFSHALPQICRKLGIKDKIDYIVYSDDVGCEKPLPYIFEVALRKLDVKPEESIHIGDSYKADVLGARAVGITPILVCNEDIYDDCIYINNLFELLKLLGIDFLDKSS